MPGQRLPMRKIRDVLRLTAAGMSSRKIAASLVVGATTVVDCLQRARAAGVSWPLLDDLSDEALEARLFPASTALAEIRARRPQPHWPTIHRELRRPGVTLQLVWEEHRAAHPEGYGYSRFCELYRAWEGRLSPTMRQTHVAGERLFVDYAGTTLDVIDASTGEAMPAQLFVAALGASNYTYAEATWTQGLADWIGSHECAGRRSTTARRGTTDSATALAGAARRASVQPCRSDFPWTASPTAPCVGVSTRAVITHPFLPTSGTEIDVVGRATHWGEERVVYLDADGRMQSISTAFTDLCRDDEFRRIAAGRAAFRTCDLLDLWRRLDALLAGRGLEGT